MAYGLRQPFIIPERCFKSFLMLRRENMKKLIVTMMFVALAGCNESKPVGQNPPPATGNRVTANRPVTEPGTDLDRDNTGVNVRDRDHDTKTSIDQNENKEDVRITAEIRKRIVDTKMSVDAQNAKIITQDGHVTLRGPVKTDDERNRLEK